MTAILALVFLPAVAAVLARPWDEPTH